MIDDAPSDPRRRLSQTNKDLIEISKHVESNRNLPVVKEQETGNELTTMAEKDLGDVQGELLITITTDFDHVDTDGLLSEDECFHFRLR